MKENPIQYKSYYTLKKFVLLFIINSMISNTKLNNIYFKFKPYRTCKIFLKLIILIINNYLLIHMFIDLNSY